MQPVSAIVVFLIIWWTVIFCVLPIGVARQFDEDTHTDHVDDYVAPGSPPVLNMKKKLIITTVISAMLWMIIYLVIASEIIDFRSMIENEV